MLIACILGSAKNKSQIETFFSRIVKTPLLDSIENLERISKHFHIEQVFLRRQVEAFISS